MGGLEGIFGVWRGGFDFGLGVGRMGNFRKIRNICLWSYFLLASMIFKIFWVFRIDRFGNTYW